ncbi:hypothetical protein D3C84_735900 [compost metagenome]
MASYTDSMPGSAFMSSRAKTVGLPMTSSVSGCAANVLISAKAAFQINVPLIMPEPGKGSMGNAPGFSTVSQGSSRSSSVRSLTDLFLRSEIDGNLLG